MNINNICIIFFSFNLELCLTSNIKCKTVSAYMYHQFKYLYKAGHPITIGVSMKNKIYHSIKIQKN